MLEHLRPPLELLLGLHLLVSRDNLLDLFLVRLSREDRPDLARRVRARETERQELIKGRNQRERVREQRRLCRRCRPEQVRDGSDDERQRRDVLAEARGVSFLEAS